MSQRPYTGTCAPEGSIARVATTLPEFLTVRVSAQFLARAEMSMA